MNDKTLDKAEKKLDKIEELVADIKGLIDTHREIDDGNTVDLEDEENEWEENEELDVVKE
tara:strand:- start:914 stop:1093 length:180 start_codon:yes stop_codon:yes gene_type:complete